MFPVEDILKSNSTINLNFVKSDLLKCPQIILLKVPSGILMPFSNLSNILHEMLTTPSFFLVLYLIYQVTFLRFCNWTF